ncbi:AEC family transporter [Nisaea sp.]|uniref:AEC family transporter n=2 Tax=Alphaproteobacteria TaxID=28211 RepID=UPI0032655AED
MLYQLFTIIVPVFICAGIGYAWARLKLQFDNETITSLVTLVGTPSLVFGTLVGLELSMESLLRLGAGSALVTAVTVAVVIPILFLAKKSVRAFLPALMFPNTGNIGLPLCLFAFGQEGLALAISYFAVQAVVMFTIGTGIASGQFGLSSLTRNPIIYAVAAALACIFTDIQVPKWIIDTADLAGGMCIPLLLFALGVSLAKLRVSNLMQSFGISALRLVLGFGSGVLGVWILGTTAMETGVLILMSSMPVAIFPYLFAVRYNREPETIAGCVIVSTIIGFVTMPGLLYLVFRLSGTAG